MIVNVVDSAVFASSHRSGHGIVNINWNVGSPFPANLPPQVGIGAIQLMRIIAPRRDLALLSGLLQRALPSLRRYFVPRGWIEIYGQRGSNTIGGALTRDALNTIGGTLRRDVLNTIGGSLGPDRANTIGGALRGDRLNTIGGALTRDALNTIGGTLRRDALNTIGGSLGPDQANTIGGSLAPDLVQAVMGAQCLYLRP